MGADTEPQREAVGERLLLTVTEKQKNVLSRLHQLAALGVKHKCR